MINKQQITLVLAKLNEYKSLLSDTDAIELGKADFCIDVLERFEANYEEWIKSCPLSNHSVSKYISEKYIGANGISDELYLSCARFLREYVFLLERKGIRESWVNGDWSFFRSNAAKSIRPENRLYLDYILNGRFDIDILNNLLGDRSYEAFLNYERNVKEAEEKLEIIQSNVTARTSRLESFLENKERKVNNLANLLEKYKTAFNFVGLSKGFENLLDNKRCAKYWAFCFLILLSGFLLVIPLGYIYLLLNLPDSIKDLELWKLAIPFVGLEVVLLYFFRVILNHYNVIQTQIIQLELRQSLCQFIQSYADYAKEIKEKDSVSLEKFENLIFSSILSTPDKVPSTFDGLEQLSNLIKNLKPGS